MAERKNMRIAFHHGGIIPASVLKAKKDKSVGPHEEVTVPAAYGKHLCDDKFAYELVGKKSAKDKTAAEQTAADLAEKVETAQSNLTAAQTALDEVEGQEAKDAAQEAVTKAQAALSALEGK